MSQIFVGEEHVQVYDLWKQRGDRAIDVCHIDFHCDMRGLLIDRRRGRAHLIDAGDRRVRVADSGNFVAHAIMEGIVSSFRWVHDPFGGRRYDTGTVKYESDLTALPHRVLHRLRGGGGEVALRFEETTFEEWDGVRAGEHFDIDWDGIASIDYDVAHIRRLMDYVIERDYPHRPASIYLIYSPGYSHPDRSLFDEFLERLSRRLEASVTMLPAYDGPPHHAEAQGMLEAVEKRIVLGLRRVGIF